MEPQITQISDNNKREEPEDDKATVQSPASSAAITPRRTSRGRGVGRKKGVSPSPCTNGATPGTPSSGRVLRDRSTRTLPAWLQSEKSDDAEESSPDKAVNRRRKAACPRPRKNASSAASTESTGEVGDDSSQAHDSGDPRKPTDVQAHPHSQNAQTRAKAPSARGARGSAKPVCKSEPGTDNPTVEAEAKVVAKKTVRIEKKEENEEDVLLGGEDESPFQDDPKDLSFQPQSQSGEISSDDDIPFRDDLNDQSYNPEAETTRDAPKPRRKPPPRQKEKKEKEPGIKIEGTDVKLENEFGEGDLPRKRGRRRKDDKSPRLPKRRKKPPVQYVRCEMEGCGTVLAHPRYLQHHIKYQHLLKKKFVCPHPSCGRLFRLQKQLLRHAKHHTDQRDYICEFCARAFKSSHNLAVHRMIHTGEKPLQCEICGFTCRQKASLNWHMKKHDADATYQFSCSICNKKFEKKDSVVAHKAKSHPEVLIAEALAANAGALITTPASLLEASGVGCVGNQGELVRLEPAQQVTQVGEQVTHMGQQVAQMGQVSHQVVVVSQDQGLHAMQMPLTIALSPIDPPSPSDTQQQQTHHTLQLQMPLHFVQQVAATSPQQQQAQMQQLALHSGSVVTQQHQPQQLQQMTLQSYQQQQQNQQPQILHMTFQTVDGSQTHLQQIPLLATPQQLQTLQSSSHISTANLPLLAQVQPQLQPPPQTQDIQLQDPTTVGCSESYALDDSVLAASSPSANTLQQCETVREGEVVWEGGGEGDGVVEGDVLTDATEVHMQHVLI
ncbi:E3 ubiquitin-protein ligase ZFP91 isoform X2 [Salmo salar]|uniref:E3 ubiquitin-protein ligase ZFP91 n=1 Tax=Salmo salar TaxID=8030 RepID=A0A1S3RF13_SALSA|nr:E3 ubiquitin-protein ligase ZFP91 isoform X2 [Salmo salar]|eukprot:XP_014050903.1 PREDICTED: E3 ubiquitin-protein ligase ZFP91-like isoform X2 [Salmo salar]